MKRTAQPHFLAQMARARRRLFIQTLAEYLAIGWSAALFASGAWFFAQPYFIDHPFPFLRWLVVGSTLGLSTVIALAFAIWRRPSALQAALDFDRRCGLRERITTLISLDTGHLQSAAGTALTADVNKLVDQVRVAEHFPVRLPRSAWAVPLLAAALALVAVFYQPIVVPSQASADELANVPPEVKKLIDKKITELQKRSARKPDDRDRSAELERLEAELDKIAQQPHETREQARELIKDLTGIEEQIKKREQELAERAEAMRDQMKQIERFSERSGKDGPARDFNDALEKGDIDKARSALDRLADKLKTEDEIDRLQKKLADKSLPKEEREQAEKKLEALKDKAMSKEDRQKLGDQMKDIKDKIKRMAAQKKEKRKELEDRAKKGELDADQLKREMEKLDQSSEKLNQKDLDDLKDMAEKLGRCEEALKEARGDDAAKLLSELGDDLGSLFKDGEMEQLEEELSKCEGCKKLLAELESKGTPGSGERPESTDGVTNSVDRQERSKVSRGRLRVLDTVPGEGFKGPRKPAEMTEDIRRAVQDAPEAIDRQRLPRSASDMARGYFEKMRGDREKKEKP